MHTSQKERGIVLFMLNYNNLCHYLVILSWLVDKKVPHKVLEMNNLIEEQDVECQPEKVPLLLLMRMLMYIW